MGQFAPSGVELDILTLREFARGTLTHSKIESFFDRSARQRTCSISVVASRKGQKDMRPELKDLMQELQMAFNESVCESERIAEILADIKSSGYDVVLALEVTIGMTATKPEAPVGTDAGSACADAITVPAECNFTDLDRQFLQSMHVVG